MMEVTRNPSQVKMWAAASKGEDVDWIKLFADYQSTVDFPASVYYRELMEVFPDAKVVHSVREPGGWHQSTLDTIYQGDKFPLWLASAVPLAGPMLRAMQRKVWGGMFEGRFEERDFAIQVFEDYTAEVIKYVPPEKLLVFDVKQGWEPLCDFLGVPVPDEPFPHLNDRASMTRIMGLLRVAPWVLTAVVVGLMVWLMLG